MKHPFTSDSPLGKFTASLQRGLAVRVDLTDVEFFDAAGVCAIADGAAECERLGNRLVVTGYSSVTRTRFELCELEALLGEPARG
jgi:anti-anti-sigma factor